MILLLSISGICFITAFVHFLTKPVSPHCPHQTHFCWKPRNYMILAHSDRFVSIGRHEGGETVAGGYHGIEEGTGGHPHPQRIHEICENWAKNRCRPNEIEHVAQRKTDEEPCTSVRRTIRHANCSVIRTGGGVDCVSIHTRHCVRWPSIRFGAVRRPDKIPHGHRWRCISAILDIRE